MQRSLPTTSRDRTVELVFAQAEKFDLFFVQATGAFRICGSGDIDLCHGRIENTLRFGKL
jgi:hypothetical protein